MKLRWSPEAAAEFAHLVRHIRKDNPSAATRVARVVVDGIAQLKKFPSLGRRGRVDGTRELVLPPLPFVVVTGYAKIMLKSPESCMVHNVGLKRS